VGLEHELKFSVTEDSWPLAAELAKALSQHHFQVDTASFIRQRDRYYDTATQALRQAGLALRKRSVNGQTLATLKMQGQVAGASHVRDELELPMVAASWPAAIVSQLTPHTPVDYLRAQLELVTERLNYPIVYKGEEIAQLSFDSVRANYPGQDQQVTFHEVEIEARGVSGPFHLQAIAGALTAILPLTPSSSSKLERAAALLSLGAGFYA
jgi:inorganic triphosphatase YgiF